MFLILFFISAPMEQIRRKTLLQGDDSIHGNSSQTGLFSSLRNSKLLSRVTDAFEDHGKSENLNIDTHLNIDNLQRSFFLLLLKLLSLLLLLLLL